MENHDALGLKWSVRIRLQRGREIVYGYGVSQLMQLTEQHGSLHAAAKEMGMSYRKALYIVKRSEKALGQLLLNRVTGGAGGGGSELTPFARIYVKRFQSLQMQVEDYVCQLAADSYGDLIALSANQQ